MTRWFQRPWTGGWQPSVTPLTLFATSILVLGAYLPWARPNPAQQRVRLPLFTKLEAGFEMISLLLLVPALIVLVLLARRSRLVPVAAIGAGCLAVAVPLYYLHSLSLVGVDASFVPASGWYLTLAGGVGLALVGGVQLRSQNGATDG